MGHLMLHQAQLQPYVASKETFKLAPVGQRASKLHKELNQSSATRVSPTKLKVCAVQRLVWCTSGDKVIELNGIHLTTHMALSDRSDFRIAILMQIIL